MSRREGRESDSKRHRSRIDREPSPKRSRRDGKPETERDPHNPDLDGGNQTDRDQRHRRRLQDALPLEAPLAPDSKVETAAVSKESDKKINNLEKSHKKTNELKEFEKKTTVSSDPTEVPHSNSNFQHDEHGSAGKVDRSFSRQATNERGSWRDSKDWHDDRTANITGTNDTRQRDEKSQARRDDNHAWRHDGFFQMEADPPLPPPPARRKPAFSEKKISRDSENAEIAATEPGKPNRPDHPVLRSERREERGSRNGCHFDTPERPFTGDRRPSNRVESPRGGGPTKERYGGGGSGNYRGRERFSGRQGYSRPGGRIEKWKHDLFDEANKSPTRKNEEDQIAKVEALLSSS